MIIALGIDPGLRATGFSIIQGDSRGCRASALGVISPATQDLASRLTHIHDEIAALVRRASPDVIVLEDLFSHVGFPRAALLMAHARGVIYLAAAEAGCAIETLAPAAVKRALCGSGRGSKAQVQAMVTRLLALGSRPDPHAADAAALALTALSRRGLPPTMSVGGLPRGTRPSDALGRAGG